MKAIIARFDLIATELVQKLPQSARPLMRAASLIGQPVIMGTILAISALTAWLLRQPTEISHFLVALLVFPLASVIKLGTHRTRPVSYTRTRLPSYSFPSGHSYGSLLALSLVAITIGIPPVIALLLVIIILIGVSRVYLGAHFPSDVIGGWLIGSVVVMAIIFGIRG